MKSYCNRKQTGAVLVVALILLMVLTILGVSSMKTTGLEERMSANSQERGRALQAADSGIIRAFQRKDSLSITKPVTGGSMLLDNGVRNAGAYFVARYIGEADAPVSSGEDEKTGGVATTKVYYFDIQSVGGNSVEGDANGVTKLADTNSSSVVANASYFLISNSTGN